MAKIKFDRNTSALLLIDLQLDFLPDGALPVAGGDRILSGVESLMRSDLFSLKVATQDWHPPDHVSFASKHEGCEPFETVVRHGHEQILWPDHCVQGTPGADLHPSLQWDEVDAILRKGRSADADSYSGFRDNSDAEGKRPPTGLAGYLNERGVETIFLCGLARDVCVMWTAQDGADAGFKTYFFWDLTRAVNPENNNRVHKNLSDRGVKIINKEQLCR